MENTSAFCMSTLLYGPYKMCKKNISWRHNHLMQSVSIVSYVDLFHRQNGRVFSFMSVIFVQSVWLIVSKLNCLVIVQGKAMSVQGIFSNKVEGPVCSSRNSRIEY